MGLAAECAYSRGGQRRFLPRLKDDQNEYNGYWPSLNKRKKVLVNNPVQGGAADVFVRSINKFAPLLPPPPECQMINLVHDEVNFLVTPENAKETLTIVTRGFEESFSELFGDQLKVKLEAKLGSSWAKGTTLK